MVNCNESITLRPQPDVDSGEICQIPLGSTVSYVGTASKDFMKFIIWDNTDIHLLIILRLSKVFL